MSDVLMILSVDMWALLSAKAEGKAEEELESCNQSEGLWAYLRILLHQDHRSGPPRAAG